MVKQRFDSCSHHGESLTLQPCVRPIWSSSGTNLNLIVLSIGNVRTNLIKHSTMSDGRFSSHRAGKIFSGPSQILTRTRWQDRTAAQSVENRLINFPKDWHGQPTSTVTTLHLLSSSSDLDRPRVSLFHLQCPPPSNFWVILYVRHFYHKSLLYQKLPWHEKNWNNNIFLTCQCLSEFRDDFFRFLGKIGMTFSSLDLEIQNSHLPTFLFSFNFLRWLSLWCIWSGVY